MQMYVGDRFIAHSYPLVSKLLSTAQHMFMTWVFFLLS